MDNEAARGFAAPNERMPQKYSFNIKMTSFIHQLQSSWFHGELVSYQVTQLFTVFQVIQSIFLDENMNQRRQTILGPLCLSDMSGFLSNFEKLRSLATDVQPMVKISLISLMNSGIAEVKST